MERGIRQQRYTSTLALSHPLIAQRVQPVVFHRSPVQLIEFHFNHRTVLEQARHCPAVREGLVQDLVERGQVVSQLLHWQLQELFQRNSIRIEVTSHRLLRLRNNTLCSAQSNGVLVEHLKVSQLKIGKSIYCRGLIKGIVFSLTHLQMCFKQLADFLHVLATAIYLFAELCVEPENVIESFDEELQFILRMVRLVVHVELLVVHEDA